MRRGAVLAAGLLVIVAASGAAQDLSLSLSSGLFFPGQEAFREIYGSGIPLSLDVWVGLGEGIGTSIGFAYLSQRGTALNILGPEDEYPLEFRMFSIPLSVFYRATFDKVVVRLGAGLGFHSYREAWKTIDIVHKGNKWAPLMYATFEHRVSVRLDLFTSIRYETIPTGTGSPVLGEVNLGGWSAVAGLLLHIY